MHLTPSSKGSEKPEIRLAVTEDLPQLTKLMNAAISHLLSPWLDTRQVAGSFEFMGLDTQLIEDRTYFVATLDKQIAGCGGWSRRETLFGGDHTAGRNGRPLDPECEAARIRAMYTHPSFTRRGIGRRILQACENAARQEGFLSAELAATVAGLPLYEISGYKPIRSIPVTAKNGAEIPLILMGKSLQ